MELVMLGTGNAGVTKCYNTCFAIRNDKDCLLVDAGGGNGILRQLELAGIALTDIHQMFITHAHTDHILGAIWVVRMVAQRMLKGRYEGTFTVYGHDKVLNVLDTCCRMMLTKKIVKLIGESILFCELKDGDAFEATGLSAHCFDIGSTKEKQYGFSARLKNGQTLTCLGDEPYNPRNHGFAANADWLMSEAFCLYADREVFSPYEKHHSTALDAGRLAEELSVKNLLLYHTEDTRLAERKNLYTEEASRSFSGKIWVPDDLEVIDLG